jgi:ABC-2 type transport system permease protein
MSLRAIRFLVRKEFLQIVRDKATLAQLLFVPFVQLLVLSNAATFTITDTKVAIVDQDHSATSRALAARLEGGGQFRVERVTGSLAEAERDLVERRASVIVHIPPRFEESLVRTHTAPLQLSLNAEEGAVAGLVGGYAQRILIDFARDQAATLTVTSRASPSPCAPSRGSTSHATTSTTWCRRSSSR